MKKTLFIIATASLIVGCASDSIRNDVVEENNVLIGFGDSYIGKKTKTVFGEINDSASLAKDGSTLKVWGWKDVKGEKTQVFNNQRVEFNSSSTQATTKWEYTPIKFWDMAAQKYLFIAVSPDTADFTIQSDTLIKCVNISPVLALFDSAGAAQIKPADTKAIDYLVADKVFKAPKGNASDDDVQFTFSHIMSKLTVRVKTTSTFNNTGNNYPQIKLTDLKIKLQGMCNTYTQKTVGVTTAKQKDGDIWNGTEASETEYTCFAVGGTVDSLLLKGAGGVLDVDTVAAYLIAPTKTGTTTPSATDSAYYTYTATVGYEIIYSATEKEHFLAEDKEIATLTSFAQNTSNILTITIDPKAIYFDVKTVNNWTDGLDGTLTIE
jgi:hypothetical protein